MSDLLLSSTIYYVDFSAALRWGVIGCRLNASTRTLKDAPLVAYQPSFALPPALKESVHASFEPLQMREANI